MAAPKGGKKVIRRRRERKHIEKAQRISSLHLTTQLLLFPIHRATLFHGQAQASSVSEVQRSQLRLPLSQQPKQLQRQQWNTA